jgi:16S rRNA (uracil1498-N3)-methyltransferase
MGGGSAVPLRALPRAFVAGLSDPLDEPFDLPAEEADKFRKVLRLASGAEVAVLPGDGRLVRCRLEGKGAVPIETLRPGTEPARRVTLALALPKPEKLEESVRMATELGAAGFVVFPSERSVVRWAPDKLGAKLDRLSRIAREAAEVAFRTRLPSIEALGSLAEVLARWPDAQVLSETEGLPRCLEPRADTMLVVGPEGGWAPREVALIGDRAVTLGPRVLRVDTAVSAATAIALAEPGTPSGTQ